MAISIKRRLLKIEAQLPPPEDPEAREQAERAERLADAVFHDDRLFEMHHEFLRWWQGANRIENESIDDAVARWPGWPAMLERFAEWEGLDHIAMRESCGCPTCVDWRKTARGGW